MGVIINADDFGLTKTCTLAIIESFEKGYIQRTTMCANGTYYQEACDLAKEHNLYDSIGIHINLTQGNPITARMKKDLFFCDAQGNFKKNINKFKPLNKERKSVLRAEVLAQIEKMESNGYKILHADSHHHIHTGIFIISSVLKVLKRKHISSIRIHSNLGDIGFVKRIVKGIFNKYLKLNGFIVDDYFGSLNELISAKLYKPTLSYEVNIHPDYNDAGELIDRNCYNPNPQGEPLDLKMQQLYSRLK